jgi:hypothetical protein
MLKFVGSFIARDESNITVSSLAADAFAGITVLPNIATDTETAKAILVIDFFIIFFSIDG